MKKRMAYIDEIPSEDEAVGDYLESILDDVEAAFMNIMDLLDITSLDQLGDIKEAYIAAKEIAEKLY